MQNERYATAHLPKPCVLQVLRYRTTVPAAEPKYYRYDTIPVHCSRGYNTGTGTVRQTTLRLYQQAAYGTPKTVPYTVLDLDLDLAGDHRPDVLQG